MVFNGSDDSENFGISANGNHVRLTRDVGSVTMDLAGVETIDLNALGGADIVTVNDLTGTDLSAVDLNLMAPRAAATARPTPSSSTAPREPTPSRSCPLSTDRGSRPRACLPLVNITGAEATNDDLTVNALGGDDVVDASPCPPT